MKLHTFANMAKSAGLAAIFLFGCQAGEKKVDLTDQNAKESYAIGISIGKQLQANDAEHNADAIAQGIKDVLNDNELALSQDELHTVFSEMNKRMRAKNEESKAKELLKDPKNVENKKAGEDFLAENAKRKGVISLPDGVQYEVLKEGTGEPVGANTNIKAHYKLSFLDGKVWQDSHTQQPFPVNPSKGGAIQGWLDVLPLMKKGSVWKLYVPYQKAYGVEGRPPQIPAFQALIFEIEIVEATPQK